MGHQQNKVAYVTGSSRGIGKSLVEKLLDEGYFVIGMARTNSIEHPNYHYQFLDLNNLDSVSLFNFGYWGASSTLLVNNAGAIGKIGPVGSLSSADIQRVMNINALAPQILMNTFISKAPEEGTKHILNISSGAGKYAIDAWSSYCASKAALDLFSETAKAELASRDRNEWHIHAVSPGVVDTQMQEEIRSADPSLFLESQRFQEMKENDELSLPTNVANKLWQIVEKPSNFPENLVSLRDF